MLDKQSGWHWLLQIIPGLEAMVESNDVSALMTAAEQHATVRKYAAPFSRRSPFTRGGGTIGCLAAVVTLKRLYGDGRRVLPVRVPVAHLAKSERELIFEETKSRFGGFMKSRCLLHCVIGCAEEVSGSRGRRAFWPIDEHLMPKPAFVALKEEDKLGLGVPGDGALGWPKSDR